jgi:hypothetical protein
MDPLSIIPKYQRIDKLMVFLHMCHFLRNSGNKERASQDIVYLNMMNSVNSSLDLETAKSVALEFFKDMISDSVIPSLSLDALKI